MCSWNGCLCYCFVIGTCEMWISLVDIKLVFWLGSLSVSAIRFSAKYPLLLSSQIQGCLAWTQLRETTDLSSMWGQNGMVDVKSFEFLLFSYKSCNAAWVDLPEMNKCRCEQIVKEMKHRKHNNLHIGWEASEGVS